RGTRPAGRAGATTGERPARPRPAAGGGGGARSGGRGGGGGGGGRGGGGRGPGDPGGRRPGGRGPGDEPAGRSLFGRRSDGTRKRSLLWRWRRPFFLIALAMLALLAGVGVMLAQTELPEITELSQSSYICGGDVVDPGTCTPDNAMTRLQDEELGDRTTVTLEELPDHVVEAVIAMEDRDFFEHDGVNPMGVARALFQNLK